MVAVLPPLLQLKLGPEEAASDTPLLPVQKLVALGVITGTAGSGLTVTVLDTVRVQPRAVVTVTVYVAEESATIEAVVAPVFHR